MGAKKKHVKKARVINRAQSMTVNSPVKERLVISCTKQEKQYVKLLAAKHNMTMSDYLLSFARKEMPKPCSHHCKRNHIPNKETAQVLKETDEGKNLIEYDSLDDFWESLGFTEHA